VGSVRIANWQVRNANCKFALCNSQFAIETGGQRFRTVLLRTNLRWIVF
jgi:hypothetical protein